MLDVREQDRFVLRQKVRLVINQYEFSVPDESGDGTPFCFVEQKRFTFKEDIRFFDGPEKGTELLRLKARQRFDPAARYDVLTGTGTRIGQIQKVFGASLLRSTYTLYTDAGEEVCTLRERSLPVALLRRLIGLVPYLGNVADWLPIPYDFEFRAGEKLLGTHRRRRWTWVDVYDTDLSGDPERMLDRRLVLAAAVGLDALQAR